MEASAPPRPRAALRSPDRLRTSGDAELVRLVRLGHEPAFEQMYDRHHRGILSFCRHMLGSRDEAEDAVQHTFIAAYRDLQASDKPIHLKAWLYTIARNRCLSMLRARREQVSIDDVEPSTDGLAAEVQRRQDLRDMLGDLHRLPDDQRAALVLSELGALSHEEIALSLEVRKDKVKALVFQARESLASSRRARDTDCQEIQQQLSILRGGSLRRTTLRRHLESCPACQAFKAEVHRQRAALALILPVAPTAGLKSGVLASALSGGAGAAGAAGGAIAGGGGALSTKFLVGAVLLGAGAGGGLMAVDELRSPPPSSAEEAPRESAAAAGGDRRDRAGRPADGDAAQVVGALRTRARTIAIQRDADQRSASGRAVWRTGIAGRRVGPDPFTVVTGATGAGGGGDAAATDAAGGPGNGKALGHGKAKKAKKPKIHQGLGAQGKGRGYGRGREPAASGGARRGATSPDGAKANGQGQPQAPAAPKAKGQPSRPPKVKSSPPATKPKRSDPPGARKNPPAAGPPSSSSAPPKGNQGNAGPPSDKPGKAPAEAAATAKGAAAFVLEIVDDVVPEADAPAPAPAPQSAAPTGLLGTIFGLG